MQKELTRIRSKYSRVIVYQARIFWDLKDYKSVELTLEASFDICRES